MRFAVLADIRANEPALMAVLAELKRLHVDRFWVIGSSIAYGADPLAVADHLYRSDNADRVLIGHPDGPILGRTTWTETNPAAARAFTWAREALQPRWWSGPHSRHRWSWIHKRSSDSTEGVFRFCSGTPLHPEGDFLPGLGVAGYSPDLHPHFGVINHIGFVGTLCRPAYALASDLMWREIREPEMTLPLPQDKMLLCPGSVGQPHDRDPRAAFVVVDAKKVTFYRIPYDIDEAARRIRACPKLSDRNAERLYLGA